MSKNTLEEIIKAVKFNIFFSKINDKAGPIHDMKISSFFLLTLSFYKK